MALNYKNIFFYGDATERQGNSVMGACRHGKERALAPPLGGKLYNYRPRPMLLFDQ